MRNFLKIFAGAAMTSAWIIGAIVFIEEWFNFIIDPSVFILAAFGFVVGGLVASASINWNKQ